MPYGEAISFIFIPMVFLGLYNLFNTEKNHYYLIFGASGLIICHNISAVLVAIFSLIYCIVNIKNIFSTRVKKGLIIDIAFILLITSFFWMPLLETKHITDYRVYEKNSMTSEEKFFGQNLSLKKLFITPKGAIYIYEIGLPVILMLMFSILTFKKMEENKKEYLFFLLSGIVTTFMATKYFPWKILPSSVYIIQFSWRMLMLSNFFFAIVCSINMSNVIKKFNLKDVIILSSICIVYIFSKYYLIRVSDEVVNVKDYPIYPVSGQNDEWLPGMGRLEYLPSKAYENSFYIATRDSNSIALEGECEITDETKLGTYLSLKISTKDEDVLLELPYIYYPGYEIRFDGIVLKPQESKNGFLACKIPKEEKGTIEINYTGTKIMNITKFLSGISFIVYSVYVWRKH